MEYRVSLFAVAACVLLASCAADPSKIAPAPVAVQPYLSLNCHELLAQQTDITHRLDAADTEQRAVRRSDAWGVALIGLPVGRMAGGNRAADIAQMKGQLAAINSALPTCKDRAPTRDP